jgi:hypothetical protein
MDGGCAKDDKIVDKIFSPVSGGGFLLKLIMFYNYVFSSLRNGVR